MKELSTGSVRKMRNQWQATISYQAETGKQKQLTKMTGVPCKPAKGDNAGKQAALKVLARWRSELIAERERENPANPSQTVAQYIERFIDENAASVEASTTSGYRKLLRNQIAPRIGSMPLDELTPDIVSSWLQDLLKEYKPVTARKGLMLLRSAMRQAVERDVLSKDPTRTVKPPKYVKDKPNALDELGRGRVVAFTDIDPTDPVSLAVRMALYTGMREGEICALRWNNVDVKARTLKVCEALGRADKADITKHGTGSAMFAGLYIKEPKNQGSIRTICYPLDLAQALELRRLNMMKQCTAVGVPFSPDMFVVGTIDGAPMHPHTLSWRWRAIVTALGLIGTQGNPPTFHDLRHTYATAAIANHVDVKTVSCSMGHTNAAMTLSTYASADPDAARRAADTLGTAYATDMARAREYGQTIELSTGTEGRC